MYHSPDGIEEVGKCDLDPQVVRMVRGGHQLVPPVDHLGQQDVYGVTDDEAHQELVEEGVVVGTPGAGPGMVTIKF